MKFIFGSLLWAALLSVQLRAQPAISAEAAKAYIVTLRREADQDASAGEHGLKRRAIFRHALNGFVADMAPAEVERLRQDRRVLAVEEDTRAQPCGQIVPEGVLRIGASPFPVGIRTGSSKRIEVDVAVIDSGIDVTHPDLNVVQTEDFTGAGFGPDLHGTHVAGIIGALDNSLGVVGVAPGVRLWSLQVFAPGSRSGYWSDFIAAMNFVAAHAQSIAVVNCSFGPSTASQGNPVVAMEQAVQGMVNQGVVVVAAAGNFGMDIAGVDGVFGTSDDQIPAALPEVMAVSSIDPEADVFASSSNFSPSDKVPAFVRSAGKGIDVAAPGMGILSTLPVSEGSYGDLSGTSMASPQVAGLVALYMAANGRATNAQGVYRIRQAIIDGGQPQSQWAVLNTQDRDSNPEPLAMASESWVPRPTLSWRRAGNGGLDLSFAAVPGYWHTLQACAALAQSNYWADLSTLVNATGNVATATLNDPSPDPAGRFYRVARAAVPVQLTLTTNIGSLSAAANGQGSFGVVAGQAGAVGTCFNFSNPELLLGGLGAHVDVPYHPGLNPDGPFTIELWAKPAQPASDYICPACSIDVKQNETRSRSGWILYQTSNNTWEFRVGNLNGYVATVTGGTAQGNAWHHIVGVYDGVSILLYANGQLVAGPTRASGFRANTRAPLRLGATSIPNRTFDGYLDEVAFYTNALSPEAINAHYSAAGAGSAGYAARVLVDRPTGYWRLEEPSSAPIGWRR